MGEGKPHLLSFQLNFLIIIITRFIDFSCRFSDSSFLSQFFFWLCCVCVCVCGLMIRSFESAESFGAIQWRIFWDQGRKRNKEKHLITWYKLGGREYNRNNLGNNPKKIGEGKSTHDQRNWTGKWHTRTHTNTMGFFFSSV